MTAVSLFRLKIWQLAIIALIVMGGALLAVRLVTEPHEPGLRVAYLSPASGAAPNIWLADLQGSAAARQITFSKTGIFDFSVSSDGRRIAFSARDAASGSLEINLLDIASGEVRQLTDCTVQAMDCRAPAWRPGGDVIAYEQVSRSASVISAAADLVRIGIIDVSANPITSRLLIDDSLVLGWSPRWSLDGARLSFYAPASAQIVIYTWASGQTQVIPSSYGESGALSPDGSRLIFSELALEGGQAYTYLRSIDLATRHVSELSSQEGPVDDKAPVWHPDGQHIAVSRQYLDDRWTRGHQVYLLDIRDGSAVPLVVDDRYNSAFFQWDAEGLNLVMQRFPEFDADGQPDPNGLPEVWAYNKDTGDLVMIAENAFYPRWVAQMGGSDGF